MTPGHADDAPSPATPVHTRVDALICGAGPVGLLLANLLGRAGLRVLVIERRTDASTIPRAIGLCEEGSRNLDMAGLLDAYAEQTWRKDAVRFVGAEGETLLLADLGGTLDGHPRLRMFFQPELEATLKAGAERFEDVQIQFGAELTGFEGDADGVVCEVTGQGGPTHLQARYLFGCDGANSTVRQRLGIDMLGATYREPWIIIDADADPTPSRETRFLCDPARPGVTMSAPGGRRRWEFVVRSGESEPAVLEDRFLAPLLAPWGSLDALRIARRTVYTFEARAAEQFARGRVFLLGDAAHLTPPFLGQGLMAGFRDAVNLAWKVDLHARDVAGDALLESYHEERRPQALEVIDMARVMGTFILPRSRFAAALRNALAAIVRWLRRGRPLRLRKPGNHILCGPSGRRLRGGRGDVGFECPQFPLSDAQEREVRIDQRINHRFSLLTEADTRVPPITDPRWERLDGQTVTVGSADCRDPDGRYARYLKGRVALIRPDRMVVALAAPDQTPRRVSQWLDEIGIHPPTIETKPGDPQK